jgi:hypothetical protein
VLSTSGLNAKEALPALIENLDQSIRESASSKMPAFSNKAEAVLVALVSIEPDIIDALPQKKIEVFSVGPRPGFGIPGPGGAFPRLNDYLMARLAFFEEAEPQWRQAINNLKKRYRVPK